MGGGGGSRKTNMLEGLPKKEGACTVCRFRGETWQKEGRG